MGLRDQAAPRSCRTRGSRASLRGRRFGRRIMGSGGWASQSAGRALRRLPLGPGLFAGSPDLSLPRERPGSACTLGGSSISFRRRWPHHPCRSGARRPRPTSDAGWLRACGRPRSAPRVMPQARKVDHRRLRFSSEWAASSRAVLASSSPQRPMPSCTSGCPHGQRLRCPAEMGPMSRERRKRLGGSRWRGQQPRTATEPCRSCGLRAGRSPA